MTDDYTPTTRGVRQGYASGKLHRREMMPVAAKKAFDRWLAQYTAEKRAEWEAEQGETEWEVERGLLLKIGDTWAETEWEPEQFDDVIAGYPHNEYARAERRVTPWLPVPDTTNTKSEG